jgi:hypothetical protein
MNGIKLIEQERNRQITEEGYDYEHDKQESLNELLKAAVCYTKVNYVDIDFEDWPQTWDYRYWKPTTTLRNLQKAGALIAAAIDKILDESSI